MAKVSYTFVPTTASSIKHIIIVIPTDSTVIGSLKCTFSIMKQTNRLILSVPQCSVCTHYNVDGEYLHETTEQQPHFFMH